MPTANDTRPAEVWTRKTTDYDLVEIEACMHMVEDDHYLIDNYKINDNLKFRLEKEKNFFNININICIIKLYCIFPII